MDHFYRSLQIYIGYLDSLHYFPRGRDVIDENLYYLRGCKHFIEPIIHIPLRYDPVINLIVKNGLSENMDEAYKNI